MPLKDPEARRAYQKNYTVTHVKENRARNAKRHAEKGDEIRAQQRAYAATHREEMRAKNAVWRASDPEKVRALAKKSRLKNTEKRRQRAKTYYATHLEERREKASKYRSAHRKEANARSAAYRAEHPEKAYAATRAWKKAHPAETLAYDEKRRAAKNGAPKNDLTLTEWQTIKEAFDFRCAYCKKKSKHLTKDHITPLSKGGSHTLSNIVPACRSCNSKKNNKAPLVPVQPLLL